VGDGLEGQPAPPGHTDILPGIWCRDLPAGQALDVEQRRAFPRDVVLAAAVAAVLAGWNNGLGARIPGPYAAVNTAATAALLVAARRAGLSWHELGLSPARLAAGVRWGGAAAAVVAAGLAVALTVDGLRPLLVDARVAALGPAELAYRALVRIPLGTVVWEEVAFRGVLLASLARVLPPARAVAVSAAVFGVWHVRPTLGALAANDLVGGVLPTALLVLAGCLATAAAGVLFAWLRLRSGSLLAPVLLHLATNVLGLLAAAATVRRG
jgi:membrane protease YdiL (CAAX protease family)